MQRHPEWTTSAELATLVGGGTTEQSIYSQMHQLRRRLEATEAGAETLIRTHRGRGHRLRQLPTS